MSVDRLRPFRTLAAAGIVLAAGAGSVLAFGLGSAWWFGLPGLLAHLGGVLAVGLHLRAVPRQDPRQELAAYLLLALAYGPVAAALPQGLDWLLAVAGAAGLLLAVEGADAVRRLRKLVVEEGEAAHLERIAPALRNGIVLPIVAVAGALVLAPALGRLLLGLPGPTLAASIEVRGVYGAAFGMLALAAAIGAAAWARHVKQARD